MTEAALTAPAGNILPFMFDNMPVRGMLLRMKDTQQYIPSLREEGIVSKMLTEMLAASAILVNDLKHNANVTLQIHSESDAALLVSQCDKNGGMRAYANFKEGANTKEIQYKDIVENKGMFAVSIEKGDHRYQSLIGLDDESLSTSLEKYFNDSVQLPTHFRIFCDDKNAGTCGAIFLQILPEEQHSKDDWERLSYILDTVTTEEALPGQVTNKNLLRRLFAEDDVRIFEQKNISITMPNIKARMETAIKSLGIPQVKELLEQGPIDMKCEFSGQSFSFKEADMRNIFGTQWEEE